MKDFLKKKKGIVMDIRLHYTEKGTGEPLILLHGKTEKTAAISFIRSIFFRRSSRVIAVDTRGHGKSPRGKAPFGIRQFAEDLRDFMDELEIERANILGFSDGGNIAVGTCPEISAAGEPAHSERKEPIFFRGG